MADEGVKGVKGVMMVDSPPHKKELLFKYAGTENMLIFVVNVLAVNRPLSLYSVRKRLLHSK